MVMRFNGLDCVRRYEGNPILTKSDVPYDAELIFNAGVCKYQGKYVVIFRNDYGLKREDFTAEKMLFQTNLGIAFSDDGIHWDVNKKPCFQLDAQTLGVRRFYDPRLIVLDGRCYVCFAADSAGGIRGGIAVTDDFERFDILYLSEPDNRNFVLFPERIGGQIVRLDRPFPVYGRDGGEFFDIWMSRSSDCRYWGEHCRLLASEEVPFCNCKIGPAAPPVKTSAGWLTSFHAVWKENQPVFDGWELNGWNKMYSAGIMLLDLENPQRILGISRCPLLTPEADYELHGFRGSVVFPGGMILEDSGEVKLYYGAADSVECLATADVNDLIDACLKAGN